MSEQLKQEVDTAEIDRLETETDVDSKTIGQDETELLESKLEDESGNEVKQRILCIWGKLHLLRFLQEWRIQQKRKLELQKLRMQSR